MSNKITVNTNVVNFFKEEMSEEHLAKIIRRTTYMLTRYHIDDEDKARTDWIRESLYYLTEFAEVLDPQLSKT